MILPDTSVWIDHFRRGNSKMTAMLRDNSVLCHAMVIGELACGNLRARSSTIDDLSRLPRVMLVDDLEVLQFIERQKLMGLGLGWVDVHLLASAVLDGSPLWSLDKALQASAHALGCDPDSAGWT